MWRGAILSPIPGEDGLQPIVCCQPARSSEGGFSGCVARLFFWLCRQVAFLAVSPGFFSGCVARLFSGCVARLFFWLARLFSGCVARLFFWLSRQVCYWLYRQVVSGWFGRGLFSDVCQCVIAQDRASSISSKSTSSGLQGDSIFLFLHRYIRYIIIILYTNLPTLCMN